ncbi:hypothetical protein [Pseudomonas graminis]|uniref:Uncharacterized protein n=1 Tax=Pseudomonas graminis TaxID=158627 RepID=A0A1C2DRP4_9PSED|nr:hypothetical protein [Pseudomonas graminis]OCX17286.1 hypothetical protein BBI10_17345 [Pseudomonas graminis]
MFISASTSLSKCKSLGDQVRVKALRLGGAWAEARENLATEAERWFGRDPVANIDDWKAVKNEVFRTE